MAPRKSDASKVVAPVADEGTPPKETEGVNMEEVNLPKSIVTRLAKGVLPPNTQIQANAVLAMTKSATVFINYLATQASEHTQAANKKTISPADVLRALDDLDFAEFKPMLELEFAKFNELATDKRNAYRKRVAAERAAGAHKGGTPAANGEASGSANSSAEPDSKPASKKPRLDNVEGKHGSAPAGEVDEMEAQSPENEHEHEHYNEEGDVEEAEEDEEEEEEEEEEEDEERNNGGELDEEPKEAEADEALERRLLH